MRSDVSSFKLSRLIQPRSRYFWLLVAFNLMTGLLAWVSQALPLPWGLRLLVAILAIGNGVLGLWALRMMLRSNPPTPAPD
jgi:protein-S-isoprenylcysteine O-methyltransferase Ste14